MKQHKFLALSEEMSKIHNMQHKFGTLSYNLKRYHFQVLW